MVEVVSGGLDVLLASCQWWEGGSGRELRRGGMRKERGFIGR